MKQQEMERGSLTLETAIVLPIFIFLMLFVYSLFGIVSAHNQISHALIQSAKSLSLDPLLYEKTDMARDSATKFWGGLDDMGLDFMRLGNDPYYMSQNDWYNRTGDAETVVKKRFIGYFSGGSEEAAEEKLKMLRVVNGLSGMDFDVHVNGNKLTIRISCSLKMLFDFWDEAAMPLEQSVTVTLWKNGAEPGTAPGSQGGGFR